MKRYEKICNVMRRNETLTRMVGGSVRGEEEGKGESKGGGGREDGDSARVNCGTLVGGCVHVPQWTWPWGDQAVQSFYEI